MGPGQPRHNPVFARQWPGTKSAGQELHILAGGDEPVLDLLAPEPAPARAFATMTVGALREAAFHQMTPAAVISPGFGAGRLRSGAQDQFMFAVTAHHAAVLRVRALGPQGTGRADALAGHILGVLALGIVATGIQPLAGGTAVTVGGLVVGKLLRGEPAGSAGPAGHDLQVGAQAALLQLAVVVDGAVLLVADDGAEVPIPSLSYLNGYRAPFYIVSLGESVPVGTADAVAAPGLVLIEISGYLVAVVEP